ncbi:MAG: enoyl-CoA hydratase/carnithine racemase [Porticoccus sp.]|jgi:enoyl-CoA hydratase/carnithine racemase
MPMTEHVRLELTDRILSIFLKLPDKKNALNQEMFTVLANAFNKVTNDHSIKSVLITGGNNFQPEMTSMIS